MVHIRKIRDNDRDAFSALYTAREGNTGAADSVLQGLLSDHTLHAYVVDLGGELGGYCLYCDFSDNGDGYKVMDVYVQPEFRRGGLGKGFLQTLGMITLDEGKDFLLWDVPDCTDRAAAFFTDMGAERAENTDRFVVSHQRLAYFTAHCACHKKRK